MARLKRRLRRAFDANVSAARKAASPEEAVRELGQLAVSLERAGRDLSPRSLISLSNHPEHSVRVAAVSNLGYFRGELVLDRLLECLVDPELSWPALDSMLQSLGPEKTLQHVQQVAPNLQLRLVGLLRYSSHQAALRTLRTIAEAGDCPEAIAARKALTDEDDEACVTQV
ncbi:MAG: hypothetical protein ACOY0T_22485 [Myxococcota bacterium]